MVKSNTVRIFLAAIVVVAAVGIAEQYDQRIAWLFAVVTLGALFFGNKQTAAQLTAIFKRG